MTPETAQRLLHEWPEWDRSITEARARLGYDPAWRPETYPDDPEHPYVVWNVLHGEDVFREAAEAVTRLGFTWTLAPYWEACFLSAYDARSLERIADRSADGGLDRVLPPADAFLEVSIDWTEGRDPRVRIEGPLGLATAETIREAAERAIELVKLRRDAAEPHPVVGRRRAAAARFRRTDDAAADARRAKQLAAAGRTVPEIARAMFHRSLVDESMTRQVYRWLARPTD